MMSRMNSAYCAGSDVAGRRGMCFFLTFFLVAISSRYLEVSQSQTLCGRWGIEQDVRVRAVGGVVVERPRRVVSVSNAAKDGRSCGEVWSSQRRDRPANAKARSGQRHGALVDEHPQLGVGCSPVGVTLGRPRHIDLETQEQVRAGDDDVVGALEVPPVDVRADVDLAPQD